MVALETIRIFELIGPLSFNYSHINEGFINRATLLIRLLIVGPEGGSTNEVLLYWFHCAALPTKNILFS